MIHLMNIVIDVENTSRVDGNNAAMFYGEKVGIGQPECISMICKIMDQRLKLVPLTCKKCTLHHQVDGNYDVKLQTDGLVLRIYSGADRVY